MIAAEWENAQGHTVRQPFRIIDVLTCDDGIERYIVEPIDVREFIEALAKI